MMARKPNVNSAAENELAKVEKQFDEFDSQVKSLTLDRMNEAPHADIEPQTKLSQKELDKSKEIYLKPSRIISRRDKFNEKFREQLEFQKQYVQFIAENIELPGSTIEVWTGPFGGYPCEFWQVPVNKPIWGPRYLAEQLTKCRYHILTMDESKTIGSDGRAQYYGSMVVDKVTQRLDARPVTKNRSIFMGAS